MTDLKKLLHLALALALPAFGACADGGLESGPPGTLSGTVQAEGEPLAGVAVTLEGPTSGSATTDASGSFSFASLPPGGYTVTIEGWPRDVTFAGASQDVFVGENEDESVDFSGSYVRTATIRGILTVDGEGREGLTVALRGPDERETTTGPDGRFAFEGIRAGDYVVEVVGPAENVAWDAEEKAVSVDLGQTAAVSFTGEFLVAATVEITRIERANSILQVDPDELRGEVDVKVHVDPGSETVSRLRVLIGDVLMATHDFGSGGLEEPTDVELRVNTADFDPETGQPVLTNGPAEMEVLADTEARGAGAASAALDVTLRNADRIAAIQGPPAEEGVASGRVRWFGNQDLTFEVVPVLYTDRELTSISLRATTDPAASGGASLDFGSGSGAAHASTGPPFVFTASTANNRGAVEDDPQGAGHTIRVVEIIDADGEDVTSELAGDLEPVEGFYADFAAPSVTSPGTDADVRVGTATPDGSTHFSSGSFVLRGLRDGGVGGEDMVTWDARTAGGSTLGDVSTVTDLTEREVPDYTLVVRSVVDALGNALDLDATPVAGGDNTSDGFGVDRTAPEITAALPDPDADLTVFSDTSAAVRFTASDPVLADGQPGSQVNTGAVSASVVTGAGSTASGWTLNKADPNYTIALSSLAEGRYSVSARAPDRAQPANTVDLAWDVALDGTAPDLNLSELPQSEQSVSGTSTFQLELGGTISDNFRVSSTESMLEVRYDSDDDPTADASCGPYGSGSLYAAPAEIDRNTVTIGEEFQVEFTAENPGTSVEYRYCIWATAADAARNDVLNPAPNVTRSVTVVDVTWN